MALTKTRTAITQVTATGQSTAPDASNAYRSSFYIKHVNGTGTITVGCTVQVQVRPTGSSTYYNFGGGLKGNLTASATQYWVVELPDDAADTRLDYTAPTGSTGHTLDGEVGEITAI